MHQLASLSLDNAIEPTAPDVACGIDHIDDVHGDGWQVVEGARLHRCRQAFAPLRGSPNHSRTL